MAWARLRIAADLTDAQLDAALAELGPQVSAEAGFLRLARPSRSGAEEAWTVDSGPDAAADEGAGDEGADDVDRPPTLAAPDGARWLPSAEGEVADEAFGSQGDESDSAWPSSSAPGVWRAGSPPPRGTRPLMTVLAVVAIGVMAILGRVGSDGSNGGSGAGSSPAAISSAGAASSSAAISSSVPSSSGLPSSSTGSIVPADDLPVGSCFVIPVATTFTEVEIRPCDVPHDGEVVAVWDEQAASAYPGESDWQASVEPKCRSAFETYTGLTWADQSSLDYGWFYPTEEAWQAGSRRVQCYLGPVDGTLTTSYRAAP